MTKTVTYKCEITLTQTKGIDQEFQEENTCMIELTCDDAATQKTIDSASKVALVSTGQILSLAVASIIAEESAARGYSQSTMLKDFVLHVAHHLNSGGERIDPEILKFKIMNRKNALMN